MPPDLERISWWELRARIAGYRAANTIPKDERPDAPTPAEFEALVARFDHV